MSKIPEGVEREELTIAARRVLLDGLTALHPHLDAITVVGAQAVYLRTPGAAIRNAPFTSDGDLSIDPVLLEDEPDLEKALRGAGFDLLYENQPGLWGRSEQVSGKSVDIELDLLVAAELADGGRGARLHPHGKMSARKTPGLEVCAVDRSPMLITSLEEADTRSISVNVAGPAALLVAKAYKISERVAGAAAKPDRLTNKDAGDVYRIMAAVPARQVAESFATLVQDPRIGSTAAEGLKRLQELFGRRAAPGVDLAVEAHAGDIPEDTIRTVAPAYIDRLT
ncbi:hypothetical protein ACFRFU_42065 [Streptomyces sp. NPDC056704]|uniref:hypothetical protein n=1 Tax=Streptomyces sp. NPDC056704 TaxID=3345917 RepID=UPI0036AA705D